MEGTNISWCDDTLNFWSGCTKVSEGCAHCYAETMSTRWPTFGGWGPGQPRKLHHTAFRDARMINRRPFVCNTCGLSYPNASDQCDSLSCIDGGGTHRREVFSLSLADWLDPEVSPEWRAQMLLAIYRYNQLRWLLLSKRLELWRSSLQSILDFHAASGELDMPEHFFKWIEQWLLGNAPDYVAIGVSAENQKCWDDRVLDLVRVPAAKRFVSFEPLLGPIDAALNGTVPKDVSPHYSHISDHVHWIIIGGESGPAYRHCEVSWIQSLADQAALDNVRCFIKQDSAWVAGLQHRIPDSLWNIKQRIDWNTP